VVLRHVLSLIVCYAAKLDYYFEINLIIFSFLCVLVKAGYLLSFEHCLKGTLTLKNIPLKMNIYK